MQDDIVKKRSVKPEEVIREKNRQKFKNVNSTINKPKEKANYGREADGLHIFAQENDPQFEKDMNIAAYLLKDKIAEEKNEIAQI